MQMATPRPERLGQEIKYKCLAKSKRALYSSGRDFKRVGWKLLWHVVHDFPDKVPLPGARADPVFQRAKLLLEAGHRRAAEDE